MSEVKRYQLEIGITAQIAKPDGECQSCVDGQCTVGDDCVAVSNPPEPYDVTCARCGKAGLSSEFIVEEGDEWECPPCYDRENAREAALIDKETPK